MHSGHFTGRVVSEWLDDGRNMRLVEPFSYVDPRGLTWRASAGSVVNGASIPKFFWRVIGGPLEGRYRRASVIHDVYCEHRSRPFRSVHRMFYDACRADGCEWWRATLMYWAVRLFGPRW